MFVSQTRGTTLGVGVGWRRELASGLLADPTAVELVEIVAESCFTHGPRRREAQALAELWPVIPHGVKLSLGSASGIVRERARQLGQLARELRAPFLTEHVAFTRAGSREIGHLTPLPLTMAAVTTVVRNVATARRELPDVPLYLENAAWTLRWPDDAMDEGSFYHEIVERTGCALLLDLGNVYANACNSGVDPLRLLRSYPLHRVGMIHLAGGRIRNGFYIDTHAHPVPAPVLALLATALGSCGAVPIIIERDARFPPFAETLAEIQAARAVLNKVAPGAVVAAPPRSRSAAEEHARLALLANQEAEERAGTVPRTRRPADEADSQPHRFPPADKRGSQDAMPKFAADKRGSQDAMPKFPADKRGSQDAIPKFPLDKRGTADSQPHRFSSPGDKRGSQDAIPKFAAERRGTSDSQPHRFPSQAERRGTSDSQPHRFPPPGDKRGSQDAMPRFPADKRGSQDAIPKLATDKRGSQDAIPKLATDKRGSQDAIPKLPAGKRGSQDTLPKVPLDERASQAALVQAQLELCELLTATAPPQGSRLAFDPAAIRRTREVLQYKRIDDALPLLPQLAEYREALWPLAYAALTAAPRSPTGTAIADALHIAKRAADEPEFAAAARRDQLILQSRFVENSDGARARRGPFIGILTLPDGRRLWIYKGLGTNAQVRQYVRGTAHVPPALPGPPAALTRGPS